MPYSIELYFDPEFEKKIRHLWDHLSEHNIPSVMHTIGSRPHLALSILDFIEESEIPSIIQYLATNFRQFELEFPSISMVPGENQAVFLSPIFNTQLIDIQTFLYTHLTQKGYSPNKYYCPNRWLPHCTVSKGLSFEETLETLKVCEKFSVTDKAIVCEAGVIEFRPRRELGACQLKAT